jgi:hypothetical protein
MVEGALAIVLAIAAHCAQCSDIASISRVLFPLNNKKQVFTSGDVFEADVKFAKATRLTN